MQTSDLRSALHKYYLKELGYHSDVQIFAVSHIQAGWESDIYAFDLVAGDHSPQALILRIYPGADAFEKSGQEYTNLKLLNRIGYPVPEAYILERDSSHLGNPFIIIERIPGQVLWQVLFASQENEQRDLIESFSRLYVQLHTLDYEPFTDVSFSDVDQEPGSVISSQLNLWRAYYDSFPIPDFLPLFDWLAEHAQSVQGSKLAVLHWDFHPENIILRPDGSLVVIDWTGLQVSDPRFDLAWTLMLISAYKGSQWRQPFLEAYERHAGEQLEYLEFFDVAACTRRLYSITGSITAGAEQMGMRPGAEETMKNQIEPNRAVYDRLQILTGIRLTSVEDWLD